VWKNERPRKAEGKRTYRGIPQGLNLVSFASSYAAPVLRYNIMPIQRYIAYCVWAVLPAAVVSRKDNQYIIISSLQLRYG